MHNYVSLAVQQEEGQRCKGSAQVLPQNTAERGGERQDLAMDSQPRQLFTAPVQVGAREERGWPPRLSLVLGPEAACSVVLSLVQTIRVYDLDKTGVKCIPWQSRHSELE